jgi:hypothetical protein
MTEWRRAAEQDKERYYCGSTATIKIDALVGTTKAIEQYLKVGNTIPLIANVLDLSADSRVKRQVSTTT